MFESGTGPQANAAECGAFPVHRIETDPEIIRLRPGIGLCLSGGGYRAMLFHAGAVWRLNEAGVLPSMKRVSSVSGGSITAGLLGLQWRALNFNPTTGVADNLQTLVINPLRRLAGKLVDVPSVLEGLVTPGGVGGRIAAAYARSLFGKATLQDLPDDTHGPRFIINATNMQTGSLWRFSRPYMADYKVGLVRNPQIPLAVAVAASSAFPPVLSPVVLHLKESDYDANGRGPLFRSPFTTSPTLADGGVYDNLGLETVWKEYETVLVSDGGAAFVAEGRPCRDWPRQVVRVLSTIDNQVRSLRKRAVVDAFKLHGRPGAYWGINTNILEYNLPYVLPCPPATIARLAGTPTRLGAVPAWRQQGLINWGYAVCDAALRRYFNPSLAAPERFPYPLGMTLPADD